MRKIEIILVVLILITFAVNLFARATIVQAEQIDSGRLMQRINEERKNRNIPTLSTDSRLNQAASKKTLDMFARDYFDHKDPDGNYVWPLITEAGYSPYAQLGENLAIDFSTESGIVKAWLNSPSHRDNMLNSKFVDQGLSAQYGDYTDRYTSAVTSLFGKLAIVTTPPPTPTPPPAPTPAPPPPVTSTPPPQPAPAPPQPVITESLPQEPSLSLPNPFEPAVTLTPSEGEQTDAPQNFQVEEPEQISNSEINILNVIRTVFIILVLLLIITVFADLIIHRRGKGFWSENMLYPMLLLLALVSALTMKLY